MHFVLLLNFVLISKAAVLPWMRPRGVPVSCQTGDENIALAEFNDGPTTSGEAGIGAEFETIDIQFTNAQCSLEDTFMAKRKTVKGHSGKNFVLSVDTSVEQGKGTLSAEYVLDGRNIKVGDGSATVAGKAVHDDLTSWKPWSENPEDQVTIEDYQQCSDPWTVRGLRENTDKDTKIRWLPQITTSMPLEALYSLMKENVQLGPSKEAPDGPNEGRNVINGESSIATGQNIRLVTAEYFKDLSLKVDVGMINDAVLGFCSLVLSYAKAADKAKAYDENTHERSPKSWIPFMPRTEFVTIYSTVKSFFPDDNELFDIFNILACYSTTHFDAKHNTFEVSIDNVYCTGTIEKPIPGAKFSNLRYNYYGRFPKQGVPTTLSIKEWIQNIDKGSPSPDMLTTFDQQYDGSIGGLGTQVERMFKLDRTAPLFEFRDLNHKYAPGFEKFMGEVDSSIQALHKKFAARPEWRVKRDVNACQWNNTASPTTTKTLTNPASSAPALSNLTSSIPPVVSLTPASTTPALSNLTSTTPASTTPASTTPDPTSPAPTTPAPTMPSCTLQNEDPDQGINARGCVCGSTTLPLLTVPHATAGSQSCSYTAMPTSEVSNPITIESQVYTANCYACTLIGGIADTPSCATTPFNGCTPTTPAVPTATVFLSNNSIPIGDENNKNNGADLRSDLFKKLKALCPDNANTCDSKTAGEFDKIETVVGSEPSEETLKFTIQDSHYDSPKERDQMVAAAVASWQQAVSKSCKEVSYEDDEDPTQSGCGTGIVRRGNVSRALMSREERRLTPRYAVPQPICDNCDPPKPTECHYKATVCAGPDHINPVLGNTRNGPYANHMNIQLSYEVGHGDSAFNEFICEVIVDGLTALALAIAPELAGAEVWEDIELQALCADLAEHIGSRNVNGTETEVMVGW